MKIKLVFKYLIVYTILVLVATVYLTSFRLWDNILLTPGVILVLTYGLVVGVFFDVKRFNAFVLVMFPLVCVILAFIGSLAITATLTGIERTPATAIYYYSFVHYTLIGLFFLLIFAKK